MKDALPHPFGQPLEGRLRIIRVPVRVIGTEQDGPVSVHHFQNLQQVLILFGLFHWLAREAHTVQHV
ncbi:hypothetical protein D3C81_2159570 [compost metagenome]